MAAQDGPYPFQQKPLGEWFFDVIVGAHAQTHDFVYFIVLGGQEYDRQVVLFAQVAEQLYAVHARHLDIENGQIHGPPGDPVQGLDAVHVGVDAIAFVLKRGRKRSEDVLVVVDEGDGMGHQNGPFGRRRRIAVEFQANA